MVLAFMAAKAEWATTELRASSPSGRPRNSQTRCTEPRRSWGRERRRQWSGDHLVWPGVVPDSACFPISLFSRVPSATYRESCCVSDAVAVGGATLLLPGCPALVSGAFPVCLSPDASLPSSLSFLPASLVHILISVSPTFSSWSTRLTILSLARLSPLEPLPQPACFWSPSPSVPVIQWPPRT